jgi:drug/metabolite transporter (DMT)-like permease
MSSILMASQLSRVDSNTISALRLGWASAFFVALLFLTGRAGDVEAMGLSAFVQLCIGALIGLGIGDTIYVASLGVLGATRAYTATLGLFTVVTYALSVALLGEALTIPVAIGSTMVIGSVYLVSIYGRSPIAATAARGLAADPLAEAPAVASKLLLGIVLVAAVAVCWSIATVWLRHVAVDAGAVAVGAVRIPAAALMVGALVGMQRNSGVRRRAVPKVTMGVLAFAGVAGTGFGSLLYIYAIQEAGAGRTAVLSALSPLFALPLSAIFLKEPITRWVAVGTVIAVAGILLLSV